MRQSAVKTEKKLRKMERGFFVFLFSLICGICLIWVGLDAQTSKVQYEINQCNQEISATEKKVRNLEIQIKSASNIRNVEQKALAMGMIHPDVDQIIYINGDPGIEEFATALIESVY